METLVTIQARFLAKRAFLVLLVCVAGFFASATNTFSQIPQGVFSMAGLEQQPNKMVLSNPDVDGVSLREGWNDLEPRDGVYDFSYFDSAVAACSAAGKKVLLRVSTEAGRPTWVDTAVVTAGGSFFSFSNNGVPTKIPVFWDPTYLAKKMSMISALGAHFSNNPTVTIVSVGFANATSEDWNVPHTPAYVTQWFALGYTSQKMLDTGAQTINATMSAFPNDYVALAVGGNGPTLDPTQDYVARNAVVNARAIWGNRMIAQKNDLSTFIPAAPGTGSLYQMIWDFQPAVGGQMVYQCYGDKAYRVNGGVPIDPADALTESINNAISYGEQYVEVYETDVMHLPTVIHWAHQSLVPKKSKNGDSSLDGASNEE